MKTFLILNLLLLFSFDVYAQTKDAEMEAEKAILLKHDDEWKQALLRRDLKYWLEALSPDIVIVADKGRVHGLQGQIGYASTTYFSSIESLNRSVRAYDGFAIVLGFQKEIYRQPTADASPDITRRVQYTKLFRKTESGWKVVAYHETRFN